MSAYASDVDYAPTHDDYEVDNEPSAEAIRDAAEEMADAEFYDREKPFLAWLECEGSEWAPFLVATGDVLAHVKPAMRADYLTYRIHDASLSEVSERAYEIDDDRYEYEQHKRYHAPGRV